MLNSGFSKTKKGYQTTPGSYPSQQMPDSTTYENQSPHPKRTTNNEWYPPSHEQEGFPKTLRPDPHDDSSKQQSFRDKFSLSKLLREGSSYYDPHSGYSDSKKISRDEMQALIGDLRAENQDLRTRLDDERRKFVGIVATAQRLQRNLDNQDSSPGGQALDSEVSEKFKSLIDSIKTWALKFTKEGVKPNEISETVSKELNAVVPGCLESSKWWQGKRLRLLIRGWIASVATEKLIRTRSGISIDSNDVRDLWLDHETREVVAILEDRLIGTVPVKDFNDWRASTMELLSRSPPQAEHAAQQKVAFNEQVNQILEVLNDFVLDDARESVAQGLQKIFESAVQLACFLRKQRVAWVVIGPAYHRRMAPGSEQVRYPLTRFNSQGMSELDPGDEEDEQKREQYVKLFVSSGLLKRGNIDGDDYDKYDCVVKMVVDVA